MNKMLLLCTLICTSHMYGMELEHTVGYLPQELQKEITQMAILSSENIDEAIQTIKLLSTSLGKLNDPLFNNIESFTKLSHKLANAFNTSTEKVAIAFNSTLAKEYNDMFTTFATKVRNYAENGGDGKALLQDIETLLAKGLDVNYTFSIGRKSLFQSVCEHWHTAPRRDEDTFLNIMKLLLENGADPCDGHYDQILLEHFQKNIKFHVITNTEPDPIEVQLKELLEKALTKCKQ